MTGPADQSDDSCEILDQIPQRTAVTMLNAHKELIFQHDSFLMTQENVYDENEEILVVISISILHRYLYFFMIFTRRLVPSLSAPRLMNFLSIIE